MGTFGRRRRALTPRAGAAFALAIGLGLGGIGAGPAGVEAHPLGNFTINHYAGLVIEPDRVLLDVVVDEAEIPAFQSIAAIDTDGDATVSDAERAAAELERCRGLEGELDLRVGEGDAAARIRLELLATGLSFPLGSSGIETLRLVCAFEGRLPAPLPPLDLEDPFAGTTITFEDPTSADRVGWREIVVLGSGVRVRSADATALRVEGVSQRLTAYPQELALQPLRDEEVAIVAAVDRSIPAVPFEVPDAVGLAGEPLPDAGPPAPWPTSGAVPGGEVLPSIFATADLTPLVLLVSVLTALALGAGHALTPGHGKTLMAAYLVGTRGTALHAVGLGLSVSVSHTAGILVLAALVVGAADVLPPDLVVRVAPLVAAVSILGIGAWMLGGEWQRRRTGRGRAASHDHGHDHPHDHPHPHGHGDDHDHGHGHGHDHRTVSWRSLFALGLAGGLIPSTSALLILLGSIAAGRPAFGVVLVIAFGLGMAVVMGGIGLVLVLARDRVDRLPTSPSIARLRAAVPVLAAALVFGFGIVLTAQALAALGPA